MKCPNPQCGRPNREGRKFCIYCGAPLPGEPPQKPQTGRLAAGAVLQGRYLIVRQLGSGGMGAVYLAQDTRLGGKVVAIKEGLDRSAEAQQQFELEATLLANLQHPNLPQVSDRFIEPGGRQYLVMEYVDGDDLSALLARNGGPFAETQVLSWAGQMLDALDYLHTQDPPIVHRDIKPDNIKITAQGTLKLVDFGISKVLRPGQGTYIGAQGWVAPGFSPLEQQVGGTDARSDLYALGATLYCLLTDQNPPEANDLAAGRETLAPRTANPAISKRTEAAILKAMQPRPENRYQTAAQMRRELIIRQRPRWLRYAVWGGAALVILVLLVAWLGPTVFGAQKNGERVSRPTETPAPSATYTPTATPATTRAQAVEATSTRAPTHTPMATSTLVPPTRTQTATPTSTRAATHTPTATYTPAPPTPTPTVTPKAVWPTSTPSSNRGDPPPQPTSESRSEGH